MKIFIVEGKSGEYDDAREWAVAAYARKVQADRHAQLAQEEENVHWERYRHRGSDRPTKVFDPQRHTAHDRATYHVYELELRDAVPAR